jgi:LAO/AO transport system kinase
MRLMGLLEKVIVSEMKDLAQRVSVGERRAVARAVTMVEEGGAQAEALLVELARGGAVVVGITGPPGAGKSTLCDALIAEWRRREKRVAVIAVDPSSPFTGGAILGDRIRMARHFGDDGVFVRSMASRGQMGGLAPATQAVVRVFDAAGFDVVLIETVGVGQAEVEVARLADCTCVVLAPGQGDDVQALKAGLLEIADVFVLNKADSPAMDRLESEMRAALELTGEEAAEVVKTVATEGRGAIEVVDAVERFRAKGARIKGWLKQ